MSFQFHVVETLFAKSLPMSCQFHDTMPCQKARISAACAVERSHVRPARTHPGSCQSHVKIMLMPKPLMFYSIYPLTLPPSFYSIVHVISCQCKACHVRNVMSYVVSYAKCYPMLFHIMPCHIQSNVPIKGE